MNSQRGQAVLISLRNDLQLAGGQDTPVACFEWRRPRQWREWPASAGRNVLLFILEGWYPVLAFGALAQLGEHLLCKQRVIGSIPIGSTKTLLCSGSPLLCKVRERHEAQKQSTGSVAQVVRAHA
jgi:hypothetical protein